MREPRVLRSRRATRAAIIGTLRYTGGAFRPDLAALVGLSEASVFRIVAELQADHVVEQTSRTAPYPGGSSAFMRLSSAIHLAALEVSNNQLHVAIGTLGGDVLWVRTHDLPDGLPSASVHATLDRGIADLAAWFRAHAKVPDQIAVAVPGFHPRQARNPIIPVDVALLSAQLAAVWPATDLMVANSMTARAAAYRNLRGPVSGDEPTLFVYAGHGVGAARIDPVAASGAVEPVELGHTVVEPEGRPCRCGHRGCLETVASSAALADALGIAEHELIGRGELWHEHLPPHVRAGKAVRSRLDALGLAVGNALNLTRERRVVIAGWPCALPAEERGVMLESVGRALLGGASDVTLTFSEASFGREPDSGLALAGFAFIQRGGERSPQVDAAAGPRPASQTL